MSKTWWVLAAAVALVGCGEKPQELGAKKVNSPAWQGAENEFVATGWKAGDAKSWEEQIQRRAQAQNEYVRIGSGAK